MFDTLAYAKRLKSTGFTEEQAEVLAQLQAALIVEQLATKDDLKLLEERLTHRLNELKSELTIRVGGMLAIAVGVIAALVKLL
jgi:hypothetical protein